MSLAEATNFVEQGSLEKPLIIGRLVRAALGVLLLNGVYHSLRILQCSNCKRNLASYLSPQTELKR